MSKLEIITLVLIALITFIILYFCQSNFIENMSAEVQSTVHPEIKDDFYSHIYFSNIVNEREDNLNIYFIANKNPNDRNNLYFMNHDMRIVKRPKPNNKRDLKKDKFEMTDKEITNIAFVIEFDSTDNKKTNKMTIRKFKQFESVDSLVESAYKNTIQQSSVVEDLENVYFFRNKIKEPCQGFKIIQYRKGSDNKYLEIDYDARGKAYSFKKGYELAENYKHTFYFIPYLCPSNPEASKYSRGFECLYRTNI